MLIPVPTAQTWLELRALDPHSSGSLTMTATARSHARHARIERHIAQREIGGHVARAMSTERLAAR